ncbi:COP23 domain-containing protein [Kamptonema formosum]|uniref:COP23 domain-containing protein n=1 Tax=Kamptonema formosum TaxID=331992 RepID=UPI00034BF299|nr:COP23 domain-containing protein [Oscillatoria sp. PCC 10802]
MKVQLLGRRFTLAVALGATATIAVETGFIASVAAQQRNTFYCGTWDKAPTTLIRTSRGNVPVISWTSNFFPPPLTPQQRCEIVSQRFQEFYNQNKLKYIITGKMKGQPVVCVANRKDGDCAGLLFTLKPGSDPQLTLKRLLSDRALAAGNALNESTGEQLYINMEEFMKTELADGESAPSAGPAESGDTP